MTEENKKPEKAKTDYGNSHQKQAKAKAREEKTIEKIELEGEVQQKKIGLGTKIKHLFFGGDFKHAAQYVAAEVILPGVRNVLADATKGAVDRVIYGDRVRDRRTMSDSRSRVTYNRPVQRQDRAYLPDQPPGNYRTNTQEANQFIFQTRQDADKVLSAMYRYLESYDYVTLADVYEMLDLPTQYTDNKWGWTELRASSIEQKPHGFILDLPPMRALD